MTPAARAVALVLAWAAWLVPFVRQQRRTPRASDARIDTRARWGIVLQAIGYAFVYIHGPAVWASPIALWRAVAGAVCGAVAIALAWASVGHLGRQWRMDAGLNPDHQLVRSGAYRLVRHPIYSSMLWMLLLVVAWLGTWPGWVVGAAFFIAGTEIRVRVEDSLLRERFGQEFERWRSRVKAYVPFVR